MMRQPFDRIFTRLTGPATILAMLLIAGIGCGQEEPTEDVGKATSAITVGTMGQLAAMGTTGSYTLTANLNASGTVWTPHSFSGTFDGANHTISNLTIDVNNGFDAGFFTTMANATVRRVRFINLRVTSHSPAETSGGLAGRSLDSLVEDVGVEVTVTGNGASDGGGIFGEMFGGTINRCYTKGSVNSTTLTAGGIVGLMDLGTAHAVINQSYAITTIAPTNTGNTVSAGGIAGWTFGADIREVYSVANVTGRGNVGGLVGLLACDDSNFFVLNHGIYRGNVTDLNRTPAAGGWAGVVGGAGDCSSRFDQLWWDAGLDPSTAFFISPNVDPNFPVQIRASDSALKTPTTPSSSSYHFADNNLMSTIWYAGTNLQHHALVGLPGGLGIQPR